MWKIIEGGHLVKNEPISNVYKLVSLINILCEDNDDDEDNYDT